MSYFNIDIRFFYTTDEDRVEFPVDPVGGDEVQQSIKRSKESDTFTISIIQNMEFVRQARELLVSNFFKNGAAGKLLIEKFVKRFNKFEFSNEGYIDNKTLSWDKIKATADFVESDFAKIFKDNKKERFELDRLTDINGDAIPALERSKAIHRKRKIPLESKIEKTEDYIFLSPSINFALITPRVSIDYADDNNVQSVFDTLHIIGSDVSVSNCFHFNSSRDKTLKLIITSEFTNLTNTTNSTFIIERYNNGIDLDFVEAIELSANLGTASNVSLDTEVTIDLSAGESLSFGLRTQSVSVSLAATGTVGDTLIIQREDSLVDPTRPQDVNFECITIKQGFERITQIMFPNVVFRSTLLDEQWPDLIIYNGYTLRHAKFIDEDNNETIPPIATVSFDDLYKIIFAITPCGYNIRTINGITYLELEDVEYSFDKEEALSIGAVQNPKYSVNNDKTFGKVRIGYNKSGQIEDINGLQATHTVNEYLLPCAEAETVYKATCDAIADPVEIEIIWRDQFADNPNGDNKNDKTILIEDCELVDINGFPFYVSHEWQEHFTSVSGIYDPDSSMNYRLSPLNCFLRHGKNFKQEYMKKVYDGKSASLLNTNGNANLVTQLIGGSPRKESSATLLSDLEEPMYTNLTIEGEVDANYDLVKLINQGKKKKNYEKTIIWYDENGNEGKAFAWDLEIKDKIKFEFSERYN